MLHFRLYLGRWRGAPNWLRDRSRKPAGRKPLVGSSPTPSARSPRLTRSIPIPGHLWDSNPQGEGCGEVLPTQSGAASAALSCIDRRLFRASNQGAAPPEERAARQGECERPLRIRVPPPPPCTTRCARVHGTTTPLPPSHAEIRVVHALYPNEALNRCGFRAE